MNLVREIEARRRRQVIRLEAQYRRGREFSILVYWVHDETIIEL